METGHPSTRAVNSGSGNRFLSPGTFGPISEDVSGIFGGVSGQGSVDTYQVTRVPGLSPAKT